MRVQFLSFVLSVSSVWASGQEGPVTIIELPRNGVTIIEPARSQGAPRTAPFASFCTEADDVGHRQTLAAVLSTAQFDAIAEKTFGQLSRVQIDSVITPSGCTYTLDVTYADPRGRQCSIELKAYRNRNSTQLSRRLEVLSNSCD